MVAGYTELSESNGWIPVQNESEALLRDVVTSAVEEVGRKVNMTSRTVSVPRFEATGVDAVAEHANIPVITADADEVVLTAVKFANRFAISIEDREDAVADAINAFKREWLSNFAIKFDNAALGTSGAANGTTVPYTSVFAAATTAGNVQSTAGALTYEDLADAVGDLEANRHGGLVIVAHPAFKMALRNLKDADGNRVVATEGVLGSGVPTAFGYEVKFSYGAAVNATASDTPSGDPLLVVANKSGLIVGQRSGPESIVSEQPSWSTDEVELKMRARRGFALADADLARVIRLTTV